MELLSGHSSDTLNFQMTPGFLKNLCTPDLRGKKRVLQTN